MKFQVTNIFDSSVIHNSGIHARENGVKIDHLSRQHIVPFRVGELRDTFRAEDHAFGRLEVKRMILDKFPCELLTWSESSAVRVIVCEPSEK
jgi:hypothetical protein